MKSEIKEALHNKKFIELNENFKNAIKHMYPYICDNDLISCYEYNGNKINLTIKVNSELKYLSVRSINDICLYKGNIKQFINELIKLNISYECILALLAYCYADGTYDGSGSVVCSRILLKENYKKEITVVNREFEDLKKYGKLLDFLLIKEKNGCSVDYFYIGNKNKGIVVDSLLLKRKILEYKDNYKHGYMRIGSINFISLRNNIDNNYCVLKVNLFKYIKK